MRDSDIGRWTHPATILVATDLSDLDHLMPFALEQAGETGARLILLHVLSSAAVITADASGMPYYDTASALETAEQMLRPWCEAAARRGIRCDALVREGHPTQQIAAAVRQFQADRVLLGTRSRSKIGKLLLAPWQNKCCARSTSRSLPWDPRLISRWQGARNASSCMPPHSERPLARAQRLPARLPPPKRQS